MPYIDRDILYEQKPVFKRDYSISTGRGCPHACTFCASRALGKYYSEMNLGKYVRQRSVYNVINELVIAKEKYNPRSIYFTDDVFTMNISWLAEFTPIYKEKINKPFYCTANPGTMKLRELELLKECGCQMIGFGLQSCDEDIRKNILKRTGSNEYIREIARKCHNLGIHFSFDHIFNIPAESEANQLGAIRFYNDPRPDIINTFDMTYLPKIELNKYLDDKTKDEVNNGKIRTGMFNRSNSSSSSIFSLLPLLPCKWITFLYSKNLTRFIRLPYPIRLLLKDIKRLIIGRYSDVFFPIRLWLYNIRDNMLIRMGVK